MRFLVTAGPTREPIDPVRFLSNRSSGKMGYAVAAAARDAGHAVTLISGPVAIAPPAAVNVVRLITAAEMFDAVHAHIAATDVLVMCAAVADFTPARAATQKIKKDARAQFVLELAPTRDILSSLRDIPPPRPLIVGFAAETENVAEFARKKLREKNCDLIVANDVSRMDTGFESDDNALTLFFASGETRVLPRASKQKLAARLVEICEELKKRN